MKKSILILFACAMFCISTCAQQVNQDLIPASTGLNLGHSNQRWNGFLQNLNISGTCFVNGMACFGNGIQHTTFASIPPEIDGTLIYCTDCQQTNPCVGGGTGAFGEGVNGVWSCSAGGLLDPGSNGIVKRTAVNTTTVAASTDIIGLFTACSGTQYLGADGACHTSSAVPGGSLGQPQYYGSGPAFAGQLNTAVSTAFNWSYAGSATDFPALTGGAGATVTIKPCPTGVDVSAAPKLGGPLGGYPVYISDGANSEAVYVSGGTCVAGSNGTLTFTPFFNHTAGTYTIQSATSGVQEAVNATCGMDGTNTYKNYGCKIILPSAGPQPTVATGINFYGTLYFHSNNSVLEGRGTTINCHLTIRGPCIQMGDLTNSNDYEANIVEGIAFRPPTTLSTSDFTGNVITTTVRTGGTITITTAAPHNFRNNDRVVIDFTDNVAYRGDVPQITVTSPTTFTYTRSGAADILSQTTPGFVILSYEPVLDNSFGTRFNSLQLAIAYNNGSFTNFFDFWDDENATVDKFIIGGGITSGTNWIGSYIYSGGASNIPNTAQQLAPVISVVNSNMSAVKAICATVLNSNGFYFKNNICQAAPMQFRVSNRTGNFQGADIQNLYSEAAAASSGGTPFANVGAAGLVAGAIAGAGSFTLRGNGTFSGAYPTVGAGGTTKYVYYVVANDVTAGTQTAPMPVAYEAETVAGAATFFWPRISSGADTITYDLLRVPTPGGSINVGNGGFVAPTTSTCTGGAANVCGSIATAQAQCAGLVCSFADNTSLSTSAYTVLSASFAASPDFWPGPATMTSTNLKSDQEVQVTGISFQYSASAVANSCGLGTTVSGGFSSCLHSSGSASTPIVSGLILPDFVSNAGSAYGVKGRINLFGILGSNNTAVTYPHEIITLIDSNPFLTRATTGHRPAWSVNDTWLGTDGRTDGAGTPTTAGMALASPLSISQYIAVLPNSGATTSGTNWLEQLSATKKEFKVPLQIDGATSGSGTITAEATGGILDISDLKAVNTATNTAFAGTVTGRATSYQDVAETASPGNPIASTCRMYIDSTTHVLTGLNSAGGNCLSGGLTGSGVSGQVTTWTGTSTLAGNTDFLYSAGKVTIPQGSGSAVGIAFNGVNNTGFGSSANGIVQLFSNNNTASNPVFRMARWTGSAYILSSNIDTSSASVRMFTEEAGQNAVIAGGLTTTSNSAGVYLGGGGQTGGSGNNDFTATSGVQAGVAVGAGGVSSFGRVTFAPTSGTASFHSLFVNPTINQTGGANGTIRVGAFYPLNTALVGTEYLIAAGTAASSAVNAVLTDKFTVDNSGNVVSQGSVTATTSVKGATYLTATNCAANGTAANPSVVSCSAASAGAFSCDVAASSGTCTVNTSAVTANSEIFVQEVASEGARLTVTCNTSPTVIPAITLASKVAGTSFTINMPTITTNPACFIYNIVN